ncbi:MAG: Rieske (2Fe-2S) protein [Segetibacter sp.]
MPSKNIKWVKVAESESELQWQDNRLLVTEVKGNKITLGRKDNKLFACAYKCPHAGGVLADGFIDATGNIVCPLHRYKFSLSNGRNVSGEGYYLKVYAIENREDGVFVGIEENNFLKIFS